jgi:hypothetical protein
MLKYMWTMNTEVVKNSLMLKVFGPLVFGDATFFISLGLDSCGRLLDQGHTRRVTFNERKVYEIIRKGGEGIIWVDKTLLSIHVSLWDVERRLLSYLVDIAANNPDSDHINKGRVHMAVEYVMADIDDLDLQNAFSALLAPDPNKPTWSFEDEIVNYMFIRM